MGLDITTATLPVHETFGPTIQGEGQWAGSVVSFIRLAGCPVRCSFCDTGYADGGANLPRTLIPIDQLVEGAISPICVISGGEPFIHNNLGALCQALIDAGRRVHIETSGAYYQAIPDSVWVTLSPKAHATKYSVDDRLWQRCNEIKLVISDGSELDFYNDKIYKASVPVYLQPEWYNIKSTMPIALALLHRFPNFFLSIQAHKYIGVQ